LFPARWSHGGDPGMVSRCLQALCRMSAQYPVLYVSGEESAAQVALRAKRLALDVSSIQVLAENDFIDVVCVSSLLA
jgi:DNA repair protein RadA/Sms